MGWIDLHLFFRKVEFISAIIRRIQICEMEETYEFILATVKDSLNPIECFKSTLEQLEKGDTTHRTEQINTMIKRINSFGWNRSKYTDKQERAFLQLITGKRVSFAPNVESRKSVRSYHLCQSSLNFYSKMPDEDDMIMVDMLGEFIDEVSKGDMMDSSVTMPANSLFEKFLGFFDQETLAKSKLYQDVALLFVEEGFDMSDLVFKSRPNVENILNGVKALKGSVK